MSQIVSIRQDRASPNLAKSVLLRCPACGVDCVAVYPSNATREQKMKVRHDVITEHAKVCVAETAEVKRVWVMEYPRI